MQPADTNGQGATSAEGRWVKLRPVERADFRAFFTWRSDLTEALLWTTQGRRVVTFEQFVPDFERWLRDSIIVIAEDRSDNSAVGFARAYNVNLSDGTAFVQAYVVPPYRLRPHVWELAAVFSDYLFGYFPLRKAYAELPAHNEYAASLYTRLGFKQQACLTEHVWYRDRYWDWLIYALPRDAWKEARQCAEVILQVEEDIRKRSRNGEPAVSGKEIS